MRLPPAPPAFPVQPHLALHIAPDIILSVYVCVICQPCFHASSMLCPQHPVQWIPNKHVCREITVEGLLAVAVPTPPDSPSPPPALIYKHTLQDLSLRTRPLASSRSCVPPCVLMLICLDWALPSHERAGTPGGRMESRPLWGRRGIL